MTGMSTWTGAAYVSAATLGDADAGVVVVVVGAARTCAAAEASSALPKSKQPTSRPTTSAATAASGQTGGRCREGAPTGSSSCRSSDSRNGKLPSGRLSFGRVRDRSGWRRPRRFLHGFPHLVGRNSRQRRSDGVQQRRLLHPITGRAGQTWWPPALFLRRSEWPRISEPAPAPRSRSAAEPVSAGMRLWSRPPSPASTPPTG